MERWIGMGKGIRSDLCGEGEKAVGRSIFRALMRAVWTRMDR